MSAPPRVERAADAEQAAALAASEIAASIAEALAARGAAHVALCGGRVERAYELLGGLVGSWTGVQLWYGDERVVPHDSPDSNHRLARSHLRAPGATWHPVATARGPAGAADAYARELEGVVLDVAFNGIGPDGHTASLFPRHPALRAAGIATAVLDAPKPPPERVTLTLAALNASRRIVLLATGAEKAAAVAGALGDPGPEVPASLLARDRLVLVADAEALGG